MKLIRRSAIAALPLFPRPAFADTLHFPADLLELEAGNISDLLSKYAQMQAFAEQQATDWRVMELTLEHRLEQAELTVLGEEPRLLFLERWKLNYRLQAQPKVQSVKYALIQARTRKEQALSLVRQYELLGNALSRELSRRLASEERRRFVTQ